MNFLGFYVADKQLKALLLLTLIVKTLLDENLLTLELNLQSVAQQLITALSFGQTLPNVTAKAITLGGNCLKPFSPVNLTYQKNESDLFFSWQRRNHINGDLQNNVDISLLET